MLLVGKVEEFEKETLQDLADRGYLVVVLSPEELLDGNGRPVNIPNFELMLSGDLSEYIENAETYSLL